MAGPLRIEYPGAVYHVLSRGVGRRKALRTYKWSSYTAGIGLRKCPDWLDRETMLLTWGAELKEKQKKKKKKKKHALRRRIESIERNLTG